MPYVIGLLVAVFVTAYGNAMMKVTYRRDQAKKAGKPTKGTSRAYDLTGLVLFWFGVALTAAWMAWVGGFIDPLAVVS